MTYHIENTTLIAQLDPGIKLTWWRLIRRDHQTGQDHVLSPWTIANTPKTAERCAREHGAEAIETIGGEA